MNKSIQSMKSKVIQEFKELPCEDDVIRRFKRFISRLEVDVKKLQKKEREKHEEALLKLLEEVTEGAAKRVTKGRDRLFLLKAPKEFAESFGFDTPTMTLPSVYDDEICKWSEWKDRDKRLISQLINSICEAIMKICESRLDDGFTEFDLYLNIPQASLMIAPFLDALREFGFLVCHSIKYTKLTGERESEIFYLTKQWLSAESMYKEVMDKLDGHMEIPYAVVRLLRYPRPNVAKWKRIVQDVE